jgi:hypothetical protein
MSSAVNRDTIRGGWYASIRYPSSLHWERLNLPVDELPDRSEVGGANFLQGMLFEVKHES